MRLLLSRVFAGAVALAFVASAALAQVTPNSAVTPQLPTLGVVQFLQGTDTAGTYKTLYTCKTTGGAATKITGMVATTSDGSAAHVVTVQVQRSAVKYGGVAVNVPISSGFANAVPPVDLLAVWTGLPKDASGNPYLFCQTGDTIVATFATALTAATVVNIIAVAADF